MTRRTVRRTPAPVSGVTLRGRRVISGLITLLCAVFALSVAPARAEVDAVARGLAATALNPAATLTPPPSPRVQQIWQSSSLARLQAPASPAEHYPLGINGQEQSVWTYNGYYYDLFTASGGPFKNRGSAITLMTCPTTADPTAAAAFLGSVSGTTLTVTEPIFHSGPSPDNMSPIQAGMTLQEGTGAVIQPFGTAGTTGTGGAGTYALSGSPGDVVNPSSMSANYWSVPVAVLGSGFSGITASIAHGHVYQEGSTLYYYFTATNTAGGYTAQSVYVATADVSDPTTWTGNTTPLLAAPGKGTITGNINVIKSGATYYMFAEALFTMTDPVEGTTDEYETELATSSTPTGAFTATITPLQSLRPTPNGSVSDVHVYVEGSTAVAYYHAQSWGRFLPSDIYRATIPLANLGTDAWSITNNRAPVLSRKHLFEVDQTADPALIQSANGTNYLFYEGADNAAHQFELMVAPLYPQPYQYDGQAWKIATSGYDAPLGDRRSRELWGWAPNINVPASYLGAWTPTANASSATGGYLVSDGAQNDYLIYNVNSLSPGYYQLTLTYETTSAGGVITALLGDDAFFAMTLANNINLLTFSNTFTNAIWSKLNVSAATTSATTAPDGTNNAFLLTSTATGADRVAQFNSTTVGGRVYTLSANLKAGTVNGYLAFAESSTVEAYTKCTLSGSGSCTLSGTGASSTITSLGNGWYHVTLTQIEPGSGNISLTGVIGMQDNTGTTSGYPANGTAGGTLYVNNAQMEQNSSESPYEPVTSATADTYSASPAHNVTYTLGFRIFGTEIFRHQLKLLMAAKNASSSAYGLSLQGISIQRQGN